MIQGSRGQGFKDSRKIKEKLGGIFFFGGEDRPTNWEKNKCA
jgi:hypothetical protein